MSDYRYNQNNNNYPKTSNRPVQGRPAPKRSTASSSTNRQLQNQEGAWGTEGSIGLEGTHGIEGTQSMEGAAVQKSNSAKKVNRNTEKQALPSPQSNLLDFSDMDREDVLRGLLFSEILGKPKALRRGRW